jgi:hypothetical protein
MSETVIYRVAQGRTIWSEKHQKHFYEGEIVDLSHASGADIAAVIASGAIVQENLVQIKADTRKVKSEVTPHA